MQHQRNPNAYNIESNSFNLKIYPQYRPALYCINCISTLALAFLPYISDTFLSTSFGVDVVALKRSIAFNLLHSRAHAYRAICDVVKTPRSDKDHSLSLRPRSSVRSACACTQVAFGPTTPAPAPCGSANGPNTGQWSILC